MKWREWLGRKLIATSQLPTSHDTYPLGHLPSVLRYNLLIFALVLPFIPCRDPGSLGCNINHCLFYFTIVMVYGRFSLDISPTAL